MAKKKEQPKPVTPVVLPLQSWTPSRFQDFVNPDYVEPVVDIEIPTARELSTIGKKKVVLLGKGLHHFGVNGKVKTLKGGEPHLVESHEYQILKEANLIETGGE